MWGFLSEFWDSISSVADYPVEFFENIGKAVAGAIGNFFDFALHIINDIPILIGWITSNLWTLITPILNLFNFVITFIKKFFIFAFKTGNFENFWNIPPEIKDIFACIPYWNYFSIILGISILTILTISVIKKLERL